MNARLAPGRWAMASASGPLAQILRLLLELFRDHRVLLVALAITRSLDLVLIEPVARPPADSRRVRWLE